MNSHIVLFMQIMQKHSKQRMWSRILAICALTLILTQQKLLTAANKHQLSLMLSYADFAKRIHIACKTDYISVAADCRKRKESTYRVEEKKGAKFGEESSVRANLLCHGCPDLVGSGKFGFQTGDISFARACTAVTT